MLKSLRLVISVFLLASIAWSAREFMSLMKLARDVSTNGVASGSMLAKAFIGAQSLDALNVGLKSTPESSHVMKLPRTLPQKPIWGDTNSAPGTIVSGRGASTRFQTTGGGVILNADGSKITIVPPYRPPSVRPTSPLASPSITAGKMPLSIFDKLFSDRQSRAKALILASAISAFGLIIWARRWRPR